MFDKRKPHELHGGKDLKPTLTQAGLIYDGHAPNSRSPIGRIEDGVPLGYASPGHPVKTYQFSNNPLAKEEPTPAQVEDILSEVLPDDKDFVPKNKGKKGGGK